MGRKILTFLIILLLLAGIGFVGYVIYAEILKQPEPVPPSNPVSVKPEIVLTQEYNEEKNTVLISAHATVEDESGIQEIVLPDGTNIYKDEAEYEVADNDEYTFKVIANNGEEKTAKIEVTDINELSFDNPYVPTGFSVLEGSTIENGFVIADEYGNQYVWIPVESGKLSRSTVFDTAFEENASTASALVNSVAKYHGFYIGRFESTEFEVNGTKTAASMQGRIPWTNITYLNALDYANNAWEVYGYEDCTTALLNSYAWDTTLNFLDTKYENYSSSINYGNYDGLVRASGATQSDIVYQICDIAGNVSEWTTERYKKSGSDTQNKLSRVVRGGAASLSRTPSSRRGYAEDLLDPFWGFRLILYK